MIYRHGKISEHTKTLQTILISASILRVKAISDLYTTLPPDVNPCDHDSDGPNPVDPDPDDTDLIYVGTPLIFLSHTRIRLMDSKFIQVSLLYQNKSFRRILCYRNTMLWKFFSPK